LSTKLEQAIQILKHVENPTQSIIIDVAKELKCSERWVWEAKKRLLAKREETLVEFNLLKEIASDLIWVSSYMEEEMELKGSLKNRDKVRLNIISERVEKLKQNIELRDYINIKEEREVRNQLKVIEKRKAIELQEYMKLKEEMESVEKKSEENHELYKTI